MQAVKAIYKEGHIQLLTPLVDVVETSRSKCSLSFPLVVRST